MTTTSTPTNQSTVPPGGAFQWIRALLRRLFGAPAETANPASSAAGTSSAGSSADVIIAPGGFRIQKPHLSETSANVDLDTFDDLLPDVREGLSLLPPLPTVVLELLREIQSSSSTAASVADIASSDPSLAASLLRAVNSAAFGLTQKVTSTSQAVSLLGFSAVRTLVIRFRLEAMLPQLTPASAAASEDIWTHSLAVSYIAGALASRIPEIDRGFVSTLGLLHDIGRLAICSRHPNYAAALKAVSKGGQTLLTRETAAFGADHAAIGAMLGNRWQLPADLNTAIRWHHAPQKAFEAGDPPALRKAAYLVQLADQIAKFCFAYSDDMQIDLPADGAMELLGFNTSLPQLLDAKVRTAATQAILFADENSKRPLTAIRPFLKLRTGPDAVELARNIGKGETHRITVGSAGADLIEAAEPTFEFDPSQRVAPAAGASQSSRYIASATPAAADWLVKTLPVHWQSAGVPARTAACARAFLRALLPNLLAALESHVDVAWEWEAPTLHLAVRSPAMAFASRFPANSNCALEMLEAELANVLNLGWFDAETSEDGATFLLRSR